MKERSERKKLRKKSKSIHNCEQWKLTACVRVFVCDTEWSWCMAGQPASQSASHSSVWVHVNIFHLWSYFFTSDLSHHRCFVAKLTTTTHIRFHTQTRTNKIPVKQFAHDFPYSSVLLNAYGICSYNNFSKYACSYTRALCGTAQIRFVCGCMTACVCECVLQITTHKINVHQTFKMCSFVCCAL